MLPNILSLLRLFSPVVIIPLFDDHVFISFVIFFISGWTDFLDGFFARRYGKESNFGSVIDPIADKVLLFSMFFYFYLLKEVPLWLFVISALRDFAIVIAGMYLMKYHNVEKFSPLMMSKVNTCFQLMIFFVIFAKYIFNNFNFQPLLDFFCFMSGITVVLSSLLYIKMFGELCRK